VPVVLAVPVVMPFPFLGVGVARHRAKGNCGDDCGPDPGRTAGFCSESHITIPHSRLGPISDRPRVFL
jgi:hypothetical protein